MPRLTPLHQLPPLYNWCALCSCPTPSSPSVNVNFLAQTGKWAGEKKQTRLHTHTDEHSMKILLWCWCNATLTLKSSHPPHEMALWFEGAMREKSGHAPTLSSFLVTWCHQPWPQPGPEHPCYSHVSDLFIARLQLFRLVTRPWPSNWVFTLRPQP